MATTPIFSPSSSIRFGSRSNKGGASDLTATSGQSRTARPTPSAFTRMRSSTAILRRVAVSKWMITWSEKRPDLPVTTPRAPCAAPLTTSASLPTQAKTFRPRFLLASGWEMLTPGWTQSPDLPNALATTETL